MVYQIQRYGRLKDPKDFRDLTTLTDESTIKDKNTAHILRTFKEIASPINQVELPPAEVDLSRYNTPVKEQGNIGACVGFATAAMDEFFKKKKYGSERNGSGVFIYKVGRAKEGWAGDTGMYCRTGVGVLRTHGIVPWDYYEKGMDLFKPEEGDWDAMPDAIATGWAQNYQLLKYIRLDPDGLTGDQIVNSLKLSLANGFGFIFGFTCYSSLQSESTNDTGGVPFPSQGEEMVGGHCIFACGYNDTQEINNPGSGEKTTGAFKFKNSWSADWGDEGYGYMPYKYFSEKLADDCYTITRAEWLDEKDFSF